MVWGLGVSGLLGGVLRLRAFRVFGVRRIEHVHLGLRANEFLVWGLRSLGLRYLEV